MGLIKNLFGNSLINNAVQEQKKDINTQIYSNNLNPYNLFDKRLNIAGKYDNFYGDSSKIVSVAAGCGLFYVDDNNDILDDTIENTFAYYIKNPNDSYPQTKVLSQIITELITNGYSDLFFYRKDGTKESRVFEPKKKYSENDFRGLTLVSGEDKSKLSKLELANIVRITYGVSQQNVFMGYSPTQAAQSWRKMQDEMGLHMTKFAQNSGMPIGKFIITAPDPEAFVKLRDALDGKVNGAKNNGKILYDYRPTDSKTSQIEWVQFTSNKVQDYTNQLEFAEKKISQDFGVPGTIKGTNDSENYATAGVSRQNFMLYTIKPLMDSLKEQLQFYLAKRFELSGELKTNIVIPELADESLVKIQATSQQVVLFDQKIAEGYSPESIVEAFSLPESFLMLEKTSSTSSNSANKIEKTKNSCSCGHCKQPENSLNLDRPYQNIFTEEQRKQLEAKFNEITTDYANTVLENGITDEARLVYEGQMAVEFSAKYAELFDNAIDDVSEALTDILGTVDVASLNLTDEELAVAVEQYTERVKDFSKSFAEQIDALDGETLEVRQLKSEPYIERVVVTETEHTRIVSELDCWTKSADEFPVKVWKTWRSKQDDKVCPDCQALDGTTIDVTALFVNSPNISEIYEVQGGGRHPNCVFGDTEIVATDVNALTRFAYTGDKINILTSSGRRLSVTPNHILLTDRGWVAAKNIKDSDNIVAYGTGAEAGLRTPNIDNSDSVISKIFETFRKSSLMTTKTMPLSTVDFHGDAVVNEKVDIIFPNSLLGDDGTANLDKFGDNSFFVVGRDVTPTLNCLSTFDQASIRLLASTDSNMRSVCESEPLDGGKLAHTDKISLATIANYDTRLNEVATNNTTTDVKSLREFQLANPSIIEFDKVSSVEVDFVTHEYVYDLSSYTKLYSANGIVSSNCRCKVQYEMEKNDAND